MRILMNGFIAFAVWSAISTYLYVCKMQGLCDEPIAMQVAPVKSNDIIAKDAKNVEKEQVESPKDLVIHFAFDKSEFHSDAQTEKYFIGWHPMQAIIKKATGHQYYC